MARFSESQAKKFLEEKPNKELLAAAVKHDRRVRLHTESALSERPEHADFLKWVKEDINLSAASYAQFKGVFTLPAPTVEISERIFEELSKVWDSDNGFTHLHCTDETHTQHAEGYLAELDVRKRMREEGWRYIQSAPSSLVVIDLPKKEGSEDEPKPYFYFLPIDAVEGIELEDVNITGEKRIGAICFSMAKVEGHKRSAVICDESYRVFQQDKDGNWLLEHAAAHSLYSEAGELISGLGYCPVTKLLSKPLTLTDEVTSQSPISSSLGELDHLLYLKTAQKVEDSSILFPVTWRYRDKCVYYSNRGSCTNGRLIDIEGDDVGECPACKAMSMKGPGMNIDMDIPTGDKPALPVPVGVIYPEVDALQHLQDRIDAKERKIVANCVGGAGEETQKQAMNEAQVDAGFESKTATLVDVKGQLEKVMSFIIDTTLKLMCQEAYQGSEFSLGTRFFLKEDNVLLLELKEAKASGAPVSYQALIREEVQDSRYRHDPERKARAKILSHLEPYPDLNTMECLTLAQYLDPQEIQIKLQFSGLIRRFEREYVPVQRYMPNDLLPTRIEKIKQILLTYLPKINEPDSAETTGAVR